MLNILKYLTNIIADCDAQHNSSAAANIAYVHL